jgi:hypothetical protein
VESLDLDGQKDRQRRPFCIPTLDLDHVDDRPCFRIDDEDRIVIRHHEFIPVIAGLELNERRRQIVKFHSPRNDRAHIDREINSRGAHMALTKRFPDYGALLGFQFFAGVPLLTLALGAIAVLLGPLILLR